MAKPQKDKDRRAIVDEMRRKQQRAEKRRTYAIIATCAVVGLAIIAVPAIQVFNDAREQNRLSGESLASLGTPAARAGCQDVEIQDASGNAQHKPVGSKLFYNEAPPAFGPHYPSPAPFDRKFYTAQDRPELEYLVHNLEHGYNILWYDETIAADDAAVAEIEAIAAKFSGDDYDPENKFIAAPWTEEDGPQFPDGMHVALTHWSLGTDDDSPETQKGIWKYCEAPSGEVVEQFHEDYPYEDSPEPRAA